MHKIGQVAQKAGVSVDTVRFYERRGVLTDVDRLPSGYRVFGDDAIERIRLTKSLQTLGMTLNEVVDALDTVDAADGECVDERWRIEAILERTDKEIKRLTSLRKNLVTTLAACDGDDCAIAQ